MSSATQRAGAEVGSMLMQCRCHREDAVLSWHSLQQKKDVRFGQTKGLLTHALARASLTTPHDQSQEIILPLQCLPNLHP